MNAFKYLALACLALLMAPTITFTQDVFYEKYDWESYPEPIELIDSLLNQPSVVLENLRAVEVYLDAKEQEPYELFTVHRRVKVNTEEAIEDFNRVYISTSNALNLVEAKARVILPDGEVLDFDESNIKRAEDLEESGSYVFFAIDGIIKGAEVEYLYTTRSYPDLKGAIITMQNGLWNMNNSVRIICPDYFAFAFKPFGLMPEPELDSLDNDRIQYRMDIDTLPPATEELFSAYEANLAKVLYTLESINNNSGYVNYGNVAENYWANTHPEISKSARKAIEKLLKSEIKLASHSTPSDKIRAIEEYIKTHYFKADQAQSTELDYILKEKFTTNLGMAVVTCAFLDLAGIEYEMGFTCDRFELKFDEEFEALSYLQEPFIYFPETDGFLMPSGAYTRYDLLPYEFTHNHALFLKQVTVGDYSTAVAKTKFIEAQPAERSINTIKTDVDLSDPTGDPTIQFERSFSGYAAYSIQPVLSVMNQEDRDKVIEDLCKITGGNTRVVKAEAEHTESADVNLHPLLLKGELVYPGLKQKAGDKYLIKIGELIGEQSTLYGSDTRSLAIENNYNRIYNRTITVRLPEGYAFKNLEDLEIDIEDLDGTVAFKSSYTLDGDVLTITVNEHYKQIEYPAEDYEAFRTVINAAADFNKIVLVLAKS